MNGIPERMPDCLPDLCWVFVYTHNPVVVGFTFALQGEKQIQIKDSVSTSDEVTNDNFDRLLLCVLS